MTVTGYAKDDVLVSADWAKAHLDDPSVRFVEVDVDTTAYDQSHIPGAVGWNWTSQLSDGVRRDIADPRGLQRAPARASGIGPDTTIVLYGDNNNWFAAWAYWQLKLYGARATSASSTAAASTGWTTTCRCRPTCRRTTRPATQLPEADFALRAFRDDILPRLGDPDLALVDVRSPAEFNGEVIAPPGMTETAQRAGHIPGAASIPWAQTVREDGTFKSRGRARGAVRGQGHHRRQGRRSRTAGSASARRHSWFVLHELLGFQRVRNYDGSWTEWGSHGRRADREAEPVAVG